jgi:PAS domain S-box-containing protein
MPGLKQTIAMPDANVSKRLQKTIVVYSALGMLIVGIAVGLVGVMPMAARLREAQKRNLLVDLQRQTVAVEQFLTGAQLTARYVGMRSKTREKLDAYNSGIIDLNGLVSPVSELFREHMVLATNIAGILLFDLHSNLVVQAGHPIPPEHWAWPELNSREVAIKGPFRIGDETFLVLGATALATNQTSQTRAGTDMVLFRTHGLRRIVQDYTGLGKTGETIVGARQNKNLPVFFPMRHTPKKPDVPRSQAVLEGLQAALEKRSDLFEPVAPLDESIIMAYGPIKGTDWGMVVAMNKDELFSPINRKLAVLGTIMAGLVLVGTFGMVVLLRPLAGRIILHTDELESQIYEKTAALNTELAERKRAEQSLRNSEVLYHSLVDTLPINILRKDLRGRVTYGNRGYCERMGKPLAALLGKSDYDLFPKELAEKYLSDDEKVVRTGEMFEDIEEHRSQGDQRLYVHVLKAPVRDAKGVIVGTQVIFWDVTARKLAEEALGKTAAELARSNKELEQFAYVASHDLQEPLRMITSYTQLIAKRYEDKLDDDAKDFMHFAVDGALRMQKLIQGLLEYSRVGTRGKPFEPFEGGQALSGAVANLKLAIDECQAKVTSDPLPPLMADPVQLTQLFQNLIGNALKFRGPKTPQIHVEVVRKPRVDAARLNIPPYEWLFSVKDNGIGVEPQYFERIFIIFQRLHTQEQYPGTGIGLAICKKIVERHGGRIWVESSGAGSTFFFALPAMD